MLKSLNRIVLILATFSLFSLTVHGAYRGKKFPPPRDLAIEMGAPFHDHAILQREMKVPVWGWTKPGGKITVEFAGQKKEATAGKDGKWMIELDPMKASFESREMTITDSDGEKEVLKDILVGEVWMASGQSNMQWLAGACIVGRKLQKEIEERVKEGKEKQPVIREGKVTNVFSAIRPRERGTKGRWIDDWSEFSAISFAFAYDVWKEVKVPVGIVNCAFSTTMLQAWAPREGFAGGEDEYTKEIYKKIVESDPSTKEHKETWNAYYKELEEWGKESAERIKKNLPAKPLPSVPGILRGNRDPTWMCNGKIVPMAPYAIRGAIWNQGYANSNEGIVYRNNLHSLIRGWRKLWNRPDLPVYFHQFYSFKNGSPKLTLNAVGEMRMGTWLAHKEIPNAAMASQIDVTGGVHYYNKAVSGQRLARHALKNQYGKHIIVNGPMYKDYKVEGDKLILELDHAEGLFAGYDAREKGGNYVNPTPVKNGEDQIEIFYIADKDKLWHKAKVKIDGEKIVLTAPGVKEPHGVAYGCGGVGRLMSIYNKAKLPMTPFIIYDKKIVISDQWDPEFIKIPGKPVDFMTWPEEYIRVAGVERDPASYGLQQKYRKLWILGPQFTHNCVIQEGVPTRFYGKAVPGSEIKFSFAGTEKTLKMGPEQDEWEVTVPPLKASAEPKTLHVTCLIDGKIAHERKIQNVVVGDVWYVAVPENSLQSGPVPRSGPCAPEDWKDNPQIRMFKSYGRRSEGMPQRFKLNASGWPGSRFFARWSPAVGLADELAKRIHAKTGKPVGIVVLDEKRAPLIPIKTWTGFKHLKDVPAWKADYEELKPLHDPDPKTPVKNAEKFVAKWKEYWENVEKMGGTSAEEKSSWLNWLWPFGSDEEVSEENDTFESGAIPKFPGATKVETKATQTFNQSICAFSPGNFKAVLCLTGPGFMGETEGADFGPQFSVMANSWKDAFARGQEVIDPHFIYAFPSKGLAPKITKPKDIKGTSTPVEIKEWTEVKYSRKDDKTTYNPGLMDFLDQVVKSVYK